MKIAFIGCGFVADFYMSSMHYHSELELIGVYDKDKDRLEQFCNYYVINKYESVEQLLNDDEVELVFNLTNPNEHFEVTKSCFKAGKHVYSEKPLAMDYAQAEVLVSMSKNLNLHLGSAPCSLLGSTPQTIWKALNDDVIGSVRLVYANFDAGMTHRFKPWNWRSVSGAPWPAKDEFEVGCTYEHAGYFLTWLTAFFGSAHTVSAFSSTQLPDKGIKIDKITPDLAIGCIEYDNGVVARVTTSIIAPLDKSLTIVGDKGVIYTRDMRDDASPVYIRKTPPGKIESALEYRVDFWKNKFERLVNWIPWSWGNHWRFNHKYRFAKKPKIKNSGKYKPVDFCSGPAEMVNAIDKKIPPIISADLALHVNEIIEVLQYPERFSGSKKIKSKVDQINLMR
jgi:predicted dehydrogenase